MLAVVQFQQYIINVSGLDHFANGVCDLKPRMHTLLKLTTQNFKNLPYSIAMRHQYYMCLQLLSFPGIDSINFLYRGDEIGKGNVYMYNTHAPFVMEYFIAYTQFLNFQSMRNPFQRKPRK